MRVHLPFLNSTRGCRALLSIFVLAIAVGVSSYLIFSSSAPATKTVSQDLSGATPSQNLNFVRLPPNLTNEFTDQAMEKLIAQNTALKASGVTDPKSFSLLPGKTDVGSIVSNIIDSELATEEIKVADLNVNASDTTSTQLLYLVLVNQTLDTEGQGMPNLSAESITGFFNDTAAKLDETATILKAMKVPPSWLSIHRDLVAFFLRERNIYRSLGAADTDPLRFMIATTRLVPADAEKEFQKIQTAINQKITDEKLI